MRGDITALWTKRLHTFLHTADRCQFNFSDTGVQLCICEEFCSKSCRRFLIQVVLSEYLPDDHLPPKVLFYPSSLPEQGCHYSQRALIGSLQMIILYTEVFWRFIRLTGYVYLRFVGFFFKLGLWDITINRVTWAPGGSFQGAGAAALKQPPSAQSRDKLW